jgi:hypothetical protein
VKFNLFNQANLGLPGRHVFAIMDRQEIRKNFVDCPLTFGDKRRIYTSLVPYTFLTPSRRCICL